jgi:hypothetical protein
MYKRAFNSTNHINHTPGLLNILQTITPGEEAFFRHSDKIKASKAVKKAKKQASLALRHFSWE